MTPQAATALEQALALHRAPRSAAEVRARPLPDDVEQLLRLAAGDSESADAASRASGESPERLREAATFYLQQVLFDADADSYRVLGVNADADATRVKRHHRWLMHWLHPDRNRTGWESVFADRVNAAWNDVRNPDRRRRYDDSLEQADVDAVGWDAVAGKSWARPLVVADAEFADSRPGLLSPGLRRRLPALVLLTMAVLALVGLGILQRLQPAATADLATSEPPGTGPTATVSADRLEFEATTTSSPAPPPANPVPPTEGVRASTPALMPGRVAVAPALPAPAPESAAASVARVSDPAPSLQALPGPERGHDVRFASFPRIAPAAPASPPVAVAVDKPPPRPEPRPSATIAAFVPAKTAAPGAWMDEVQAKTLVRRFADRYERGDVAGMRGLFVADPDPQLRGTLRDYERVIAGSEVRRIAVDQVSWLASDGGASIIGNYSSFVLPPGAVQATATHGVIRFDVRAEAGEPRIFRLRKWTNP